MIAAAAAALSSLRHEEETKKGGRGKCRHCKQYENNVSYHEAWECPKRPHPEPWLVKRMEKVSKMPPPTVEEVEAQMRASALQREMLESIPKVDQETFVKMIFR